MGNNVDFNIGIDNISDILYMGAFAVFGKTKFNNHNNKKERKYKNAWFNRDCEHAKCDFEKANRLFRRCKSDENIYNLVSKRRLYTKTFKNSAKNDLERNKKS